MHIKLHHPSMKHNKNPYIVLNIEWSFHKMRWLLLYACLFTSSQDYRASKKTQEEKHFQSSHWRHISNLFLISLLLTLNFFQHNKLVLLLLNSNMKVFAAQQTLYGSKPTIKILEKACAKLTKRPQNNFLVLLLLTLNIRTSKVIDLNVRTFNMFSLILWSSPISHFSGSFSLILPCCTLSSHYFYRFCLIFNSSYALWKSLI